MGGYNFTGAEQKQMLAMAVDGYRSPEIAKAIGRHRASVARYLKRHGFASKRGPTRTPAKVRFEQYLPKERPKRGCWNWRGCFGSTGYGQFALDGRRSIGAHVASYLLHKGEIPEGQIVRHTCDHRACVNPEHLVLGTMLDNMADCISRRRIANGERQGLSRMTASKVRELRKLYADGATQVELSARFEISQPTVSQIVRRITWRHV